jgi:4-diphosphocytidyl-2-C-methyl-D-erythritol kinase
LQHRLAVIVLFSLKTKLHFVSGRGEQLETLNTDLSHYHFLLIYPGLHIETAEAYAGVVPNENILSTGKIVSEFPVSDWKDQLKNDFELPAFAKYPELKEVKDLLYSQGAVYASMTGSGSTIYGMFEKRNENLIDVFPKTYHCKWC